MRALITAMPNFVKVEGRYGETLNRHRKSDEIYLFNEFIPIDRGEGGAIICGVAGPLRNQVWLTVAVGATDPADVLYRSDARTCTLAAAPTWELICVIDRGPSVRALSGGSR